MEYRKCRFKRHSDDSSMEYDEKENKPISIGQLLYEQVQEQSALCDVIVKKGNWQKSFHWCVLVTSPFFESIYKSKFLEKQTGTVEIEIGTPLMVETALLFLYGKEPRITFENIPELLELAEFFIIPNLKAACFSRLNCMHITDSNCLKLLEVSSRYGMDLPKCWVYLRGHLPDILQQKEALNLTKECIVDLLSDATLSYVTVQEWFHFIVCWIRKSTDRKIHFEELFRLIDLERMDLDFINNIIKKEPLLASIDNLEELVSTSVEKQHRVLLVCDAATDGFLMGFDFEKKNWYKLNLNDLAVTTDYVADFLIKETPVAGVKGKNFSEIYKVEEQQVFTQNLANNTISKSDLTFGEFEPDNDCDVANQVCDRVCFSGTSLLQISNNFLRSNATRERILSMLPNPGQIATSTLYKGNMQHEGQSIEIVPVLSFARHHVKLICANNFKCVAMVTYDDILFLYEEHTCKLDSFHLLEDCEFQISKNSKLAPTADGFVIYNHTGMLYISRLSGPSLRKKYKMGKVAFNYFDIVRYQFCENVWFRFTIERKKDWKDDNYELRCVFHEDLLAAEKGIEVEWRQLPLTSTLNQYTCLNEQVYIVSLPRRALKCHLECPHCVIQLATKSPSVSDTGSDEEKEYGSSDYKLFESTSDESSDDYGYSE